jgi:hypothetical protein
MINETKSFISFTEQGAGLIFDESNHPKFPLRYYHLIDGSGHESLPDHSYFGFIYQGEGRLSIPDGIQARMPKDTYFSHHGTFSITGTFKAVIIEVITSGGEYKESGYRAMTHIGGVVEAVGRLKYIDGCTDSLLVPPVKKGNPCLNHLHFPKAVIQTPHTHPSHRIGIVIRGEGMCETPFGELPLVEGCIFVIKEYDGKEKAIGLDGQEYEAGTHKFNTYHSSMDVIAFHPDSDFGPEDEFHPMLNRTIVKGVSAREIDAIKTK